MAEPRSTLRFLHEHYMLIEYLTQQRTVSPGQLQALIVRIYGEDLEGAPRLGQLVRFGVLDSAPGTDSLYEVPLPLHKFLLHLRNAHVLGSPEVLRAYITTLDRLRGELAGYATERKYDPAVECIAQIEETLERLRHDVRADRSAVLTEVVRAKADRETSPLRERFERIRRIWQNSVAPIKDILEPGGAMDTCLDQLDADLIAAARVFADAIMERELSQCRARGHRLRREARADFEAALHEILPLYEALRRESEVARGASRALDLMFGNKQESCTLPISVSLHGWKTDNLFDDDALLAYFADLRDYRAGEPRVINLDPDTELSEPISLDEIIESARASLPIEDALAWLLDRYPRAELVDLMRAYEHLYFSDVGRRSYPGEQRCFNVSGRAVVTTSFALERT